MTATESFLEKSTESLKNVGRLVRNSVIPFPYGYGLQSAEFYHWLMKTQWISCEELERIQNERLTIIVKHAYENVPYYHRIFDENGLKPRDIQSKEDLKSLPILTKDDVRKYSHELTATHFQRFEPSLSHTSGSTGQPLKYYVDKVLSKLIRATVWRHHRWCGIEPTESIAVFRGTLIDEFGRRQGSCYRTLGNSVHFSTFDMNEETMREFVIKLNRVKPALIQGYPASLQILAQFMVDNGLKISPHPKAVHTSSEVVLPEQREIVERAFGAPLFDWYGHGESTVCAGECDRHVGLHLNLEFGCTEFIETGETERKEIGYKIVSTSLWNFSMPFVRYDTEDLALIGNSKCSCGRGLPLLEKIIGRQADIIKGVNGVKVSPSSFVHFWKYRVAEKLLGVSYAQIVQEQEDSLLVKLVGRSERESEELIRKQLNMLLGDMRIEFEYLPCIPTGQKWRFTVSKIKWSSRAS